MREKSDERNSASGASADQSGDTGKPVSNKGKAGRTPPSLSDSQEYHFRALSPQERQEREERHQAKQSQPTERIRSNQAFEEPDPELSAARQPKKEFNLRLNSEMKRIPDYTRGAYHTKKARTRRKMTAFAKVMLAIIIVGISVFFAMGIIFTAQEVFGFSKASKDIVVEVPQNAGVAQIADILAEKGVVRSAFLFKAYFKVAKPESNFQYGTYSLNSEMSYELIIAELSKYAKSKDEVKLSFPEGFTLYQIALRLEENKVCKADDFIYAINNTDFGFAFEQEVSGQKTKFHKMEGYAFPDTYYFYKDDSPVNVAKKFVTNFDNRVNGDLRARMKELGYSLEETLTIASIVQEEAGAPEEMARVASVYSNRLKNPGTYPNLQADPTRGYARELEKQMDVVDQKVLAAYNTYEGIGLPPGPICNPGLDAIKATLYPEETNYYFFCTNLDTSLENRRFYYAETLAEHEKNLKKAGLV